MDNAYCQSCGMPLNEPEHHGTEADGSPNGEYCVYCYQGGVFTKEMSMEEMIDQCMRFLGEFNRDSPRSLTPEQARAEMLKRFPQLKRWKR